MGSAILQYKIVPFFLDSRSVWYLFRVSKVQSVLDRSETIKADGRFRKKNLVNTLHFTIPELFSPGHSITSLYVFKVHSIRQRVGERCPLDLCLYVRFTPSKDDKRNIFFTKKFWIELGEFNIQRCFSAALRWKSLSQRWNFGPQWGTDLHVSNLDLKVEMSDRRARTYIQPRGDFQTQWYVCCCWRKHYHTTRLMVGEGMAMYCSQDADRRHQVWNLNAFGKYAFYRIEFWLRERFLRREKVRQDPGDDLFLGSASEPCKPRHLSLVDLIPPHIPTHDMCWSLWFACRALENTLICIRSPKPCWGCIVMLQSAGRVMSLDGV